MLKTNIVHQTDKKTNVHRLRNIPLYRDFQLQHYHVLENKKKLQFQKITMLHFAGIHFISLFQLKIILQ